LRKASHRHEEFYRSTRSKPVQRPNVTKRFVNTILHEYDSEYQSEDEADVEGEVCAIKPADKLLCWNFDETGHRYHDCLKPRRIFSYGCGIPDIYKPNCAKCKSVSENSKQDILKMNVRR